MLNPSFIALCLMSCAMIVPVAANDDLREVQRKYSQTVFPLLENHCGDCHSGDSADAGFNLDNYQSLDQLLKARKKWLKVELRIAAKEMPPEDGDPLTDDAHQTVMNWLDQLLHSVDCTDINPGRVTLRRLNRTEYRNTIRDLLGVDFKPADDFPGDDVGYGFDNIADVISLPPILMEKYLSAAETIATLAIADPENSERRLPIDIAAFSAGKSSRNKGNSLTFHRNVTRSTVFELPERGDYVLNLRAFGDQLGKEPVKFAVAIEGKRIAEGKVSAKKETEAEKIEIAFNGKTGTNRLDISFLNDKYIPEKGKQQAQDRNLHITAIEVSAPPKKLPASNRQLIGTPIPEDKTAQRKLARKILNRLASKAFRRRTTSKELDRLLKFFETARSEGDRFEVALRFPLQVILVSPHFLYKIEAPVATGETRLLNDFELATSLSYFLWSTMPDEELFRMASKGQLQNTTAYRQQIKRMLADPKSSALVNNFAAQWLQLPHLETYQPDPDLFPGVDSEFRQDMITETKMLLQELVRQDAKITDLLTSNFTFVNQRLADYYGIPDVKGKSFQKVSTSEVGRVGLLTHASILTLTSNPTRTSPVKRGKWIMENLLGEEPPPPDPAALALEEQAELTGTNRERLEQHRADPNCAVCHLVMDELGFALENFDAVGRWRDLEDGEPIDSKGLLPDGTSFTGALEMQQTITTNMRDQFVRCLIEKLLIYATGRGLEYFDECAIDKIADAVADKDYRFSELFYQIASSDPFLKRQGEPKKE